MTDNASEYGRLLADRDRLVSAGVDPAELETPLPPLDPDPLHVEATYQAGFDDGFEAAVQQSFPPIVGTVVVAIVAGLTFCLIGYAVGAWLG